MGSFSVIPAYVEVVMMIMMMMMMTTMPMTMTETTMIMTLMMLVVDLSGSLFGDVSCLGIEQRLTQFMAFVASFTVFCFLSSCQAAV